jgi:calcineurin-like phosphoesterase family protein
MKVGNLGKLFSIACALALISSVPCTRATDVTSRASSTAGLLSEAGPTFTLKAPRHRWTLIAYGDMRFTDPANTTDTNPSARRALVAKIAAEKPDLLLLSGDVPFHGGDANDYVVYRQETAPWRTAGLRVFPAMGNHELYGPAKNCPESCLQNWWNNFPELKGRRWYSVRFGEAYFLTVDSNLELTPGSPQSQWVAKQLETLPKGTRYVFVSLHHPPMADPIVGDPSHNVRPNENALAQQLEAAAPRTKAKIVVIAGHIHAYQRFQRNGVIYLVSGGGGAKPYPIARTPADLYQDNVIPNFHYVKFVSEAGQLKATMYRLDDKGAFVPSDSFVVGAAAKAAAK